MADSSTTRWREAVDGGARGGDGSQAPEALTESETASGKLAADFPRRWTDAERALLLATPDLGRDSPTRSLNDIRKEINKVSQSYPEIGEDLWHRYVRRLGTDVSYRA